MGRRRTTNFAAPCRLPLPEPCRGLIFCCNDSKPRTRRAPGTARQPVFRARIAAAPEPSTARLSSFDDRARCAQPRGRHRLRLDRRLAGNRVFRAGCRPRLRRLPSQLSQRAAKRDDPARRRRLHRRAAGRAGRASSLALPAVLAAGDPRRESRRIEPSPRHVARPQHGDRRFRGAGRAPREPPRRSAMR